MKNFLRNTSYFLKEMKTLIRLNLLSNILSILSTGLVFFILAMIVSGWWISNKVVEVIRSEAEINVYFQKDLDNAGILQLVEKAKGIDGVREARLVDKDEAYERMEKILGKEARVLEYLEDNPFDPFIEVKIYLEKMDHVVEGISPIPGVEHIRDNKEVLVRISSISSVLSVLGLLIVAAAGISTLVVIAHIIRMGIYSNKEQINTLRLLGAPEAFIAFPFLLEGLLLTLAGGILASVLAAFLLKDIYNQMLGPLPFIPLPSQEQLISGMVILTMSFSGILGIAGSLFGLSSARSN